MGLRKGDAVFFFLFARAHHFVFDESDRASGVAFLFEPREAPAVGVERGDDVGFTVAVHVGDEDLGAAAVGAEGERVFFPERARR